MHCVRPSCANPGRASVFMCGKAAYGPLCDYHAFQLDAFFKGVACLWTHEHPVLGNPYRQRVVLDRHDGRMRRLYGPVVGVPSGPRREVRRHDEIRL